jgi:hypothetical protein
MTDKVEEFRQNAEQCQLLAEQYRWPEHTNALLRMAQEWIKLAEDMAQTKPLVS